MHPTLFEIGPFSLYSLWAAASIAFIVGTMLFLKRAKYERLNLLFVVEHSFSLTIGAILFSRLIFFLNNWGYFGPLNLKIFLRQVTFFWQPGYSFWGGIAGFTLVFLFHAYRKKENPMEWLNAIIAPLFVGIMIGNFGQLLDGQGYGKETIFPWGITFESTTVKYTVPVHPTQIYSILVILTILYTRKMVREKWNFFKDDTNWTLFAISAYSGARFLMEFLRGDDTLQFGPIRIGYIVSLFIFVVTSYFLYKRSKKIKDPKVS